MATVCCENIIVEAEKEEKKEKTKDQKQGEIPSIGADSNQLIQLDDQVNTRAYSPIIEDPRERDSRPASTDPIADSLNTQLSDNISIPSRVPSTPSSVPSRANTPVPSTSKINEMEAKEPKIQSKELSKDEKPEKASKSEIKSEPIFKPLHTDKGKSKTTGKSIGGWI